MRDRTVVYRTDFVMPKDAIEVPTPGFTSILSNKNSSSSSSTSMMAAAANLFFSGSASSSTSSPTSASSPTVNNNQPQGANNSSTLTIISDYGSNRLFKLDHRTGAHEAVSLGSEVKPGALGYDPKANILIVSDESRNKIFLLRAQDFSKTGVIDLIKLLHAPSNTGSYGIASFGNCYRFVNNNNNNSQSSQNNNNNVCIVASNPAHRSVLLFHDTQGTSQKEAPKWGVSRNGPKVFKFPSGITMFPYQTFCVVCRNTGFVHFLNWPSTIVAKK